MYLLRALNEFDITANPINNGIASKLLIYQIVEDYYKVKPEYLQLNKKEKDLFIKAHINEYLISHQAKLDKKFYKKNKDIRNSIESLLLKNNKYDDSYMKIVYALSTLNNHLINGSKTFTDWISLTSSFECIFPYYDKQDFHNVAVIESSTNGIRDVDMNTLAVDVSSKEAINDSKILCKKIDKEIFAAYLEMGDKSKLISDLVSLTKKDFMGYSFSQASKEISYYQYIPSNKVVSVLEQLQIDLIRTEIFNFEFLELDKKKQLEISKKLKYFLYQSIKLKRNGFMLKVLDELYLQNKNIKNTSFSIFERDKVEYYRSIIMGISEKIPNTLIKRRK